MIIKFQTDRPEQTVEQSDLGLHCLPLCLDCLDG